MRQECYLNNFIMSDLKEVQQNYREIHSDVVKEHLALRMAKAAYDKLIADEEKELKSLDAKGRARKEKIYGKDKEEQTKRVERVKSSIKGLEEKYEKLVEDFLGRLDPTKEVNSLNDSFPLLMFPVRLETRFKSVHLKNELWLRVYPDDCNIIAREEILSESEIKNARSFWIEIWKAGGIETEERGAWRSLVNSHGSGRSASIITEFKPVNNKPSKPGVDHKILVVIPAVVLTSAEHDAAKKYWSARWLAKGNTTLITDAFNTLKAATSDAKAKDILEKYAPVNLNDVVPDGIDASKIRLEKLELPAYAARQSSWTQAAQAKLLPDKFVAILMGDGDPRTLPFEKPVRDQLAVSLDP